MKCVPDKWPTDHNERRHNVMCLSAEKCVPITCSYSGLQLPNISAPHSSSSPFCLLLILICSSVHRWLHFNWPKVVFLGSELFNLNLSLGNNWFVGNKFVNYLSLHGFVLQSQQTHVHNLPGGDVWSLNHGSRSNAVMLMMHLRLEIPIALGEYE